MSEVADKTRKEYALVVEFSKGHKQILNINLAFDDSNPSYTLPYIDKVLHHIPESVFMMKLVCNVNDLDYYDSHIMQVYIINTRFPDKKIPILYSNLPLPLDIPDAYQSLNQYRVLELFDHNPEFDELSKKKRELFSRLSVTSDQELDFANKKFIDEVVTSYRLRRALTLTLFHEKIYHYQPPADLLPPSLEDPNQMRMF